MGWKAWTLALVALLTAPSVAASAPELGALRRGAQASMAVNLVLMVDPQGSVVRFTFDRPELLPAAVTELLEKAVSEWRFEIPAGRPTAHTEIGATITMVARRVEADRFELGIGGARFRSDRVIDPFLAPPPGSHYSRVPPAYPDDLRGDRASCVVDLIVQYDRDGNVLDVVAEQVTLRAFAMPKRLAYMRKRFAEVSIEAARGWSAPPEIAKTLAGEDRYCRARIPVSFQLESTARYGEWQAYAPGPLDAAPSEILAAGTPDTSGVGDIHYFGTEDTPRLLLPLQPAP